MITQPAREFTKEKDGFYGAFFPNAAHPNVVIIRVAGTGATKDQVISSSQFLRDAGFAVLCLGYQNWGTLGGACSCIPLDDVSRAIAWIEKSAMPSPPSIGSPMPSPAKIDSPILSPVKIGMTGISMGALYTLAAACYISQIRSVALASPFDYVMEGLDASLRPTGHSTFTWKGSELPYQPWQTLREKKRTVFLEAIRNRSYGPQRLLRYLYDHNPWEDGAALPLEKVNSHMLLLAASSDDCWPADKAVERIVSTIKATNPQRQIEHVIYEKGCHNMGGDMTLHGWTGLKMRLLMKSWRTHPHECRACIEDSKRQIVDFFYRTLVE